MILCKWCRCFGYLLFYFFNKINLKYIWLWCITPILYTKQTPNFITYNIAIWCCLIDLIIVSDINHMQILPDDKPHPGLEPADDHCPTFGVVSIVIIFILALLCLAVCILSGIFFYIHHYKRTHPLQQDTTIGRRAQMRGNLEDKRGTTSSAGYEGLYHEVEPGGSTSTYNKLTRNNLSTTTDASNHYSEISPCASNKSSTKTIPPYCILLPWFNH